MKPEVLLHPETIKKLHALPQGLLLHGVPGVGLRTIAEHTAQRHLSPVKHYIEPSDKGSIGIDAIRQLYTHARTKQAPHTILIDDADTMTAEAQNALLKLLEEPSAHIRFILTSHQPEALFSTIRSRIQHIAVRPITNEQTKQLMSYLGISDPEMTKQLLFLAEGKPAELTRLMQNSDHLAAQRTLIHDAKKLLQTDLYETMLLVAAYGNDRAEALLLIQTYTRLLTFTMRKAPNSQFITQLEKAHDCSRALYNNGHVRTQLLRLVV